MNTLFAIAPYLRLAKRLVMGSGSLQSASYRQDVLCEEETETVQECVYLPQEIDKITGSTASSTLTTAIAAATNNVAVHHATIAYHLKKAIVVNGSVYVGNYRHLIYDETVPVVDRQVTLHLGSAALVTSFVGARYFGHWIKDDCIQYVLAEQLNLQPLCIPKTKSSHQAQYEKYFQQDWADAGRATIGDLVIFQDYAQNSLKRKRHEILRERLCGHFPPKDRHPALVYLRRGTTGVSRVISNEDVIIAALRKHDFVVVDVESDPLEKIIDILMTARIVVSMEGSHIAHCTYSMPQGSGLIALQPADQFTPVHRGWTDCRGLRYGFIVGAKVFDGYYFSPDDLLHTVDLMGTKLENRC